MGCENPSKRADVGCGAAVRGKEKFARNHVFKPGGIKNSGMLEQLAFPERESGNIGCPRDGMERCVGGRDGNMRQDVESEAKFTLEGVAGIDPWGYWETVSGYVG